MAKDPSDNKYLLSDVLKWLASLAGRIGTYCANGAPSGRLLWAGLGSLAMNWGQLIGLNAVCTYPEASPLDQRDLRDGEPERKMV